MQELVNNNIIICVSNHNYCVSVVIVSQSLLFTGNLCLQCMAIDWSGFSYHGWSLSSSARKLMEPLRGHSQCIYYSVGHCKHILLQCRAHA